MFRQLKVSRWVARLLLLGWAAHLWSCGTSSKYMHPAEVPLALTPVEGYALVVFVRPELAAEDQIVTIADGEGRFLGDSLAASHFVVHVLPGEHLFVGLAQNTAAVRATVTAGQTYHVHVAALTDPSSTRFELLLLSPQSQQWKELQRWLGQSAPMIVDEVAGQEHLQERADEVQERIRLSGETLSKASPGEPAQAAKGPEDGG